MKAWADDEPKRIERAARWLLGVRAGFGDAARAILVARDAERRRPINWVLPGLALLYCLALTLFHRMSFESGSGGYSMMFRVFVFDYTLFLFAGLSGYNMARKWRSNADQVEELSLTPLPPASIGAIMGAGSCALWLRLYVTLMVVDYFTAYLDAQFAADALGDRGAGGIGYAILALVSIAFAPPALAWFHFEAARLAHWMFASHALPRISLLRAGLWNFVAMTMLVFLLSALGSAATGMALGFVAVAGMVLGGGGSGAESMMSSHTGWSLAAIPGLLMVAALKRALCTTYERRFQATWLLYQWWGAGESRQPSVYPPGFQKALPYWSLHYAAQEEEAADVPEKRRSATRRLEAMRERMKAAGERAAPPTADRNSGSPTRSPDPRSGPSHAPACEAASERSSGSP